MEIAPLRLRLLALVIDMAVFVAAIGAPVAAAIKLPTPDWLPPDLSRFDKRFAYATRFRRWTWVVSLALAPVGRNWRTPGARVAGIARVDARTGGPVTIRSAVIQYVAPRALSALSNRPFRPSQQRQRERLQDIQVQLKEIQRAHRGDDAALRDATMRLYRENNVNPAGSCLAPLIPMILLQLPALWTERRQGVTSWLAGTVVVRRR